MRIPLRNHTSQRPLSGTVLFDQSKKEASTLGQHFKELNRRLKSSWKVLINTDEVTDERIESAKVFVITGPTEKFSVDELEVINTYLNKGGSVLVLLGENGESKYPTNINYLLEQYGISINNDSVVRTSYYKYFHPKEALIPNGIVNRAIGEAAGKTSAHSGGDEVCPKQALQFLYAFGATLNVVKPATVLLSTGSVAFPLNRPVCAVCEIENPNGGSGKLAVVGSIAMFTDAYINKEDNAKIFDVIISFLTSETFKLNVIDAQDPEIETYFQIPDISTLSNNLKACLQESEEIPRNLDAVFDQKLFAMDISMVPKALAAYEKLRVKHEPLTLITPEFETPLPPLQPAVFPPNFRELGPPALELFDLDEHFSSEKTRLAQEANKCTEDDLEYFILHCGEVCGIAQKLPQSQRKARNILELTLMELVEFKKMHSDNDEISSW
ncbi:Intraflagellar transport protein 52 -like protein [Echinococcus granulosus]|uniref:Intraflagellar transport protein n=1 Tax=Echinococcus granulosus TaxID=6210 RepID=W6UHS3_ECHGR|nr:Intraflagellar transport protein [Echinococcus granulosus]EUB60598.1 Intraflagellar transport protein [Echinococcus granulosus]KAH9281620.1 Intraflagellar transport protein 52 -like protein [Echinococcus granulosus]KAH9282170.1 Intraflagellar transport protein 52 -like protein [Echinococcus granulosus]